MHTASEGTEDVNNAKAIAAATAHLVDTDQPATAIRPRHTETGASSQQRARADQPTEDGAREHSNEHANLAAAGLYIAICAYNEALTRPNPSATLDDMCDAVAEIMPDVAKIVDAKGGAEFAEALRASVADRLWAFTAIEYARSLCGDGYGFVFDLLADSVRKGCDPHIARTTALDVPKRLRENAEAAR